MCTIIRVKRKITEDPVDCLVIECKRNKLLSGLVTQIDQMSSVAAPVPTNAPVQNGHTQNSDLNEDSKAIKEVLKYAGSAQTEVTTKMTKFPITLGLQKVRIFVNKMSK